MFDKPRSVFEKMKDFKEWNYIKHNFDNIDVDI